MRFSKFFFSVCGALSLAACEVTQDEATTSGFTNPSASGRISGVLSSEPVVPIIDDDGAGFSFTAGSTGGEGLRAVAGLVDGTTVTFRPSVGTGSYAGVYALVYVDDIDLSGGIITGQRDADVGTMTLTADFANNTLTSTDSAVTVDGKLDGRTLTGSVTYRGLRGDLEGLVGGNKTVGAFHANNADLIYAGGFLAERE